MFGNIKIVLIFVPGLRLQPDAPGRFPVKTKSYGTGNEIWNRLLVKSRIS